MRLKTMRKRFFAILCTASLVFATADIEASASVISPTDVAVASSGNVLIGVDGTFMTADLQAGINRINEIRREAYEEKIVSAYVPVKLSAELEGIAKIRAAEAALEIGHTRPNGTRGMLTTYQGMRSYGEILAWNFRGGLVGGINQWYEEKEDLINETGGETGHYTQMIDPKNEYIGLGCFYCTSGVPYPYSICGEFNSYTSSHTDVTDRLEPSYDTTQLIEVPEGNVTVPTQETISGKAGESKSFGLSVKYNRTVSAKVYDLAWTSSAEDVVSVRENQIVFSKNGEATLSTTFLGISYQVQVTVADEESSTSAAPAASGTPTATAIVSAAPAVTGTPTATAAVSAAPAVTGTPTATAAASAAPAVTGTPTATAAASAAPAVTGTPTATAIASAAPAVSSTPTPTAAVSAAPAASNAPAATAVVSAAPAVSSIPTPTVAASAAPAISNTPIPAVTASPNTTAAPIATNKPAATNTPAKSVKNACKKVKAAENTYIIKKKGKTVKAVFKITAAKTSKVTTDSYSWTLSKKKIVKVQKTKLTKGKLTITLKGLKKGKTTLTVKIGKKKAKTVISVKK